MNGISTNSIHGGDSISRVADVIPPISVSTNFKYPDNPNDLVSFLERDSDSIEPYYYSRINHPNSVELEKILSKITGGYAIVYSSGLSAYFAALTYYNPKVLCIGKGYAGCHEVANIFKRNNGLKKLKIDDFDQLNKGDLIHLETPVNPHGLNVNIKYYADKAHENGAFLIVDSTFAPPPLQDPFKFGADMVIHSATKYFGGHSDLLAGFLITKDLNVYKALIKDRIVLGTNISNFNSWLLIRSIKTFELRILKQTENATKLVQYLVKNKSKFPKLIKIFHGSIQKKDYIKEQLPNGHSPTFSIKVSNSDFAMKFPSKLKFFYHATSLGGVESLIEWRVLTDKTIDPTILRISVGIENIEDLIDDITNALNS